MIVIFLSVPAVLEASDSQADKLFDHHLEIYSSSEQDARAGSTKRFLRAWKSELDENFDSFGTDSLVRLIKTLTANLPKAVAKSEAFLTILKAITALIMNLYIRNKPLEGTVENEQILAKDLLQEVLDTVPEVSVEGEISPLQHVITKYNLFLRDTIDFDGMDILDRTSNDVQLMRILLGCKIEINDVDPHGNTLLHHVVESVDDMLVVKSSSDTFCQAVVDCVELLLDEIRRV